MRLFFLVATLVLLRAPGVRAGAILYATAATENRVDGFCLRSDGSLAPTPTTQVGTAGVQPQRLVVGTNGTWTVLYVMEVDRVEAFKIGRRGTLSLIGATPVLQKPNGNPKDVVLSPDATKLYVPEPGRDRLVAYPLDANGAPATSFTSCIKGPKAPRYQRLVVANGFLYVSDASLGGRISVFPIAADGSLPEDASVCMQSKKSKVEPTCPCSERRRLDTPRALIIDGDAVYVESTLKKRILHFTLRPNIPTDHRNVCNAGTNKGVVCSSDDVVSCPGATCPGCCVPGPNFQKGCPAVADHQFVTPHKKKTGAPVPVCLKDESTGNALTGAIRWQSWDSGTKTALKYEDVVQSQQTLLGTEFFKARVDAFKLKDDGNLPADATVSTEPDVRGSPVGLAQRGSVLYVAAGSFDRVTAYKLGRNGLPDSTPFSETDALTNSFPNAVASADLPEDCQ